MKKRNKRKQPTNPRIVSVPPEPPKQRRLWRAGLALAGVAFAVVAGMTWRSTSVKRDASPAFVPRPPERAPTRFERRGERLGHEVWDLAFSRS